MIVIDSSALLWYLQGKNGWTSVEHALEEGGVCSATGWSEVALKFRATGRDWSAARALLLSFGLVIESVTAEDAERAAERRFPEQALSLGGRLCLALGDRLDAPILTADPSLVVHERSVLIH